MKLILILSLSLLGLSSLLGDFHHPGLSININPNEKDYSHLKAHHQSTFVFDKADASIILNGIYKPYLDNSHHLELGIGSRKFSGNFGFGANLFYSANNSPGFFAHQFTPGFEFFFNRFQLSINHYFPLKKGMNTRKSIFEFHNISEVGLTYKPSSKYEFGIIPFFNHTTSKFGVNGRASVFFASKMEFEIAPYYTPENKGITFSIGINFGGPKGRKHQSIRKTSELFYSSKRIVKPKPIAPIVAPVIPKEPVKPIIEIPKPTPKPEPKPQPIPEKPKPTEKPVVVTPPPIDPQKPWPFPFFFNEKFKN